MISAQLLTYFLIFVVNLSVGGFCLWRFVPRLSPFARRLAIFMFAAQIVVISVQPITRDGHPVDRWLWGVNDEGNIPTTLAAAQMSAIALLSFFCACLSKSLPVWGRFGFLALGCLFIHLALDEFYLFHEANEPLYAAIYAAIGAIIALTTLVVHFRHARQRRRAGGDILWLRLLLAGMAVAALGGLAIDRYPFGKCLVRSLPLDGCLDKFLIEEALELLGMWMALLAMLGRYCEISPKPGRSFDLLIIGLPLAVAILFPASIQAFMLDVLDYRYSIIDKSARWGADVNMFAYRLEKDECGITFSPFMYSNDWHSFTGLGYSVHLVDQATTQSVAGADISEDRLSGWSSRFVRSVLNRNHTLYRPRVSVSLPPDAPVNRSLLIVLTIWREEAGKYVRQKILSSDLPLYGDTNVVVGELVLGANPCPSA